MSEVRTHVIEVENAAREISPYATTLPLQGVDGKPRPPSRYKRHGVNGNNDVRSSNSTPSNGTHRALPVTVVDYNRTLSPDIADIVDAHKTPYYRSVEVNILQRSFLPTQSLRRSSASQRS